jgi:exodeoxyribonuclease V alpha subunit
MQKLPLFSCILLRNEGKPDQGAVTTEAFAAMEAISTSVEPAPEPEVMWYTAGLHAAEVEVADALTAILGTGAKPPPAIDAATRKLLSEGELQLSEEQQQAVEAAVAAGSRGAIVTGGPGCGKTFIMKTVVEVLQQRGLTVALAGN